MSDALTAMAALGASLLAGGTIEKVLLVVLVLAGLVALVLVVWLACKLLALLAKALLRAGAGAIGRARDRRDRRNADREAALPPVRAGWMQEGRPSLRRAIREAGRIGGRTAPWAIVVCGEGAADLERAMGMTPACPAEVRLSASERLVLVDAAGASDRTLRHLVRCLPWRRPFDAVLVLAADGAIPPSAAHRAAIAARGAGLTAALHVVLPGRFGSGAARIVVPGPGSARELATSLEAELAREWLGGAERDGIGSVAGGCGGELDEALRALRDRTPECLDLASLVAGGGRLPETIAATADRTVPDRGGPLAMRAAAVALAVGIGLAAAGVPAAIEDADRLRSLVMAAQEQSIERLGNARLVPDPVRTGSVARIAIELARAGESTLTRPAGRWIPGASAARAVAAYLLVGYVGRPLGAEIERRTTSLLARAGSLDTWVENAATADRLVAEWNSLLAAAGTADVSALIETAFGRVEEGWPDGLGAALEESGAAAALENRDVVDLARVRAAARAGLLASAGEEAKRRYLAAPVLAGARLTADATAAHAGRHAALARTREALKDPAAAWLVEPEDRLRHTEVLPVLARALGLAIVDAGWVAIAEAELSRSRRQARKDALRIAEPSLGTVLDRDGTSGRLRLSSPARAWLDLMDRIEAARIGPRPTDRTRPRGRALSGPVTLASDRVRNAQARIERYEEVEARVPPLVPPVLAESTLEHARERLAAVLAEEVRGALVPRFEAPLPGAFPAPTRELEHAIATMRRIGDWLRDHGWLQAGREARGAADRTVESHLRLGMDALRAADPVRIDLGRPGADPERTRERLARSLESVRELHRRFAAPLLGFTEEAPGKAARSWRTLVRALEAYERGDTRSGIGGLESVLAAWAADPRGTCAAPAFPPAPPGYLGQVVRRTRAELHDACRALERQELLAARDRVLAAFGGALARSWPYSGDPASPDAPAEAVDRYVSALEAAPDLSALDARHVPELERERALWTIDDEQAACIGLEIEWRARPEEDVNAHHLIAIELKGMKRGEGGYTWRYGTPVELRLKLARHSSYRFASGAGGTSLEHVERFEDSAALLRMLDSLAARGWIVRAPLVDTAGKAAELGLSVRVSRPGGAPLDLPAFASLGRGVGERRT
ncbi:MAG: hypothetical protein OXC01_13910 [Immundisolibacterales bacterium]|nr:hypothetical protein [Immundisolibacterales bacterium]